MERKLVIKQCLRDLAAGDRAAARLWLINSYKNTPQQCVTGWKVLVKHQKPQTKHGMGQEKGGQLHTCVLHEAQFTRDPFAMKSRAGQEPGLKGGVGNAR